ncbi:TPA: hypothetical protein JAG59_001270 [Legionella pneumophila]|nr:hypothetical protein [Legionella pneumophila]HAT5923642.1 hypothetical protein [Legionella pneumophila]HAT5936447.1 hypothetical protein [Legionella pneumophila]HAT5951286.1 hypothetical protein [Legionella pneumophila]HAT5961994.1 hypothetical protein [Legionella pneumophila]
MRDYWDKIRSNGKAKAVSVVGFLDEGLLVWDRKATKNYRQFQWLDF